MTDRAHPDAGSLLDVRLRHLAYLREIARAGGVTPAAARLGVSQPALSRALASLERRVGVPLVEREGRGRRLTGEGEEMLAFADRVAAQVEDLRDQLGERARGERGTLRVGMIDAASLYVLPGVVRDFRERFPGVELSLTVDTSNVLLDGVRRFELDLAFVVGPAEADLWSVEVAREPLHLYAPRSSPDDPAGSDWALYPRGQRTRALIDAGLAAIGIDPRVTLESHNPEVLRQMVALGLGWSVLPLPVAEREGGALRRGRLVAERVLVGVRRADARARPRRDAFLALAMDARRPGPAGEGGPLDRGGASLPRPAPSGS